MPPLVCASPHPSSEPPTYLPSPTQRRRAPGRTNRERCVSPSLQRPCDQNADICEETFRHKGFSLLPKYAVVRLKQQVPSLSLSAGMEGTILIVHPGEPPAYEVEFMHSDGTSAGVSTMKERDLELA